MKYSAQSTQLLPLGVRLIHPPEPPRIVYLDDPALDVMTDFHYVHPLTVTPDAPIDQALDTMKVRGVRLLLVVNEGEDIIGLITSYDIEGEKAIQLVQEQRLPRAAITVSMLMTPQSKIPVLTFAQVQKLHVGHIAETLRQLERQHLVVVEDTAGAGRQRVCGLFSMSQIRRHLSASNRIAPPEHTPTVAELVHGLR